MTSTIIIIIIILRCRGGYGRRRYIQTLMDQMTTINSSTATETAAYANTYENTSRAAVHGPRPGRTRSTRRRRWSGRARRWTLPSVVAGPREATCGSTTTSRVGAAAGRPAVASPSPSAAAAMIVALSVRADRGNDGAVEGPGSQ